MISHVRFVVFKKKTRRQLKKNIPQSNKLIMERPDDSVGGEDDGLDAGYPLGTNFWDEGNFKVVLKRFSNSARLCDEFVKMLQERHGLIISLLYSF